MTARRTGTGLQDEDLLAAAIPLLRERGLGGLTLRPLAERLDTTVSAVTHRFGHKDAIVATLCHVAMDGERATLDIWRRRIDADARSTPARIAAIADAVLDDLTRDRAGVVRLHCELIQAAASRPAWRDLLRSWLDMRARFWRFLADRSAAPGRYDLASALHCYAIDELVHGEALGDDPAYRWLRRLCLDRLCDGLFAREDCPDATGFAAVRDELGDPIASGQRYMPRARPGIVTDAAVQVAHMLLDAGGGAVTYRSVAQRAGIAVSTLAYHFPRQGDLLRAGLEEIIRSVHVGIDTAAGSARDIDLSQGSGIAAASFAVALSADRYPDLRPFVADMRRRRGENGYHQLRALSTAPDRIDPLTAQVVSVTAIGALLIRRGLGEAAAAPVVARLMACCRSPVG